MKLSSVNKPCIAKGASVNNDAETPEDLELSLIVRTVAGDEDAFECLYSLYYSRLFRFVYRTTGRLEVIDEVINDVMYVVWDKASTYDRSCRLSTWIFGIAYNKARAHNSPSKLQANQDSIDDVSEDLLPCGDNWIERLETENWLTNAFDVLSLEQRVVVELTYYHGMHYQEIALLMGCPENTVKTRMFHGRKKLATALEQHALIPPQ
jgi:RNA polymerase sigma-70 factor (ECF subfamily)